MRLFVFVLAAALFAGGSALAASGDRAVGTIPGSFDVSPSGAATYSIPLRLTPGSANTAPHLSLNYNSNSGNGALGAGWSLSGISTITRGPNDRDIDAEIRGVELDDTDALFLDGERLVEVSRNGTGSSRRVEYRKRTDDYSKIVMVGGDLNSATITVQMKSGTTLIFDGSNDSRVRLQSGSTLLLAVSRILDSTGNFIEFRYEQNGRGDYNLTSVRYTGHQSGAAGSVVIDRAPFASVEFTYEDAQRTAVGFVAGQAVERGRRLRSVWSRVTNQTVDDPNSVFSTVARYQFEYVETNTVSRFLLTKVRQVGADGSEVEPTELAYSSSSTSWSKAPYQLPIIPLAKREATAQGYRFAKLSPGTGPSSDILFSIIIAGKVEAYAYSNASGIWTKNDDQRPPFGFASEDGGDLGAVIVDLNGDGQSDLLQAYDADGQSPVRQAWLGKAKGWDPAPGYALPFPVSVNGKVATDIRLVNLSNPSRPDLIYSKGGQSGFLVNTGTNWVSDASHALPVALGPRAFFLDADCDGRMDFMAPIIEGGVEKWGVWAYSSAGWSRLDAKYALPSATLDATAGLVQIDLNKDLCSDVVVSSASVKVAYLANSSGWVEEATKRPTFPLTATDGTSLKAMVVDLDGDGTQDLLASRRLKGGQTIQLAELQRASGWNSNADWYVPPIVDDDAKNPAPVFLTDLNADGRTDLAMPLNDRAQFGRVLLNSATGFADAPDFMPNITFSRVDQRDEGVRFLDLNGDGLVDVLYRREVTINGKLEIFAGALLNSGSGWKPEPGLAPPLALASERISGNPAEFVDVDNDGFLDLLYSYDFGDGTSVRKYYHNGQTGTGGRVWQEVAGSPFTPPSQAFAEQGTGGLGVRLLDLNGDGRVDLLLSALAPKGIGLPPIPCLFGLCDWNRKRVESSAYINDGTKWVPAPSYIAPLPFVTLGSKSEPAIDLGVQAIDLNGDTLPDLIGSFKHPDENTDVREVYLNNGAGWTRSTNSASPILLDEARRDPALLIQWVDVNGDGLPDIVTSKRNGVTNNSATYLSTGRAFTLNPEFKVPLDVISEKPGDPSFRILDLNGDGLPDLLYGRETDAAAVQGAFLNNGSVFVPATTADTAGLPLFVDKEGRDLGVRIFDLNADGLVDVVQAYAGEDGIELAKASAFLNNGTRADVLTQVASGYGMTTKIRYQPLGRPLDKSDANGPWSRVYEPGKSSFPFISVVPAAFAVFRATVDDPQGRSLSFSYRYGGLRFDARTMRSVGFAWRESYNEASGVLSRQEFLQSPKLVGRVSRDATCWVPKRVVMSDNLCPDSSSTLPLPANVLRLTEITQSWTIADPHPAAGSLEDKVRQVRIIRSAAKSWELSGDLKGNEVTGVEYDDQSLLLARHGNVLRTVTTHRDGSSVQTDNEYGLARKKWRVIS